jgi:hypothetical protein
MAALVILIAAFEKYRAQHIKPAEHHHSAKPYLLDFADGRRESALRWGRIGRDSLC